MFKFVIKLFEKSKIKFILLLWLLTFSLLVPLFMSAVSNNLNYNQSLFENKYNQQDFSIDILNLNGNVAKTLFPGLNLNSDQFFKNEKEALDDYASKNNFYYETVEKKTFDQTNVKFSSNTSTEKLIAKKNVNDKIALFNFKKNNSLISKEFIYKGSMPKNDNEIAVNDFFVDSISNAEINKEIVINNVKYKIVGYFKSPSSTTRPLSIGGKSSYDILVSDTFYNKINYPRVESIIGKFNKAINNDEQRNILSKIYDEKREVSLPFPLSQKKISFIQGFTQKMDDPKISSVIYERDLTGTLSYILSIIFITLSNIILFIIVYKIIQENSVNFGILKAFGYRKHELLAPTVIFPMIIVLVSLVVSNILAYIISRIVFGNVLNNVFFLPEPTYFTLSVNQILIGCILPITVSATTVLFSVNRILKKKTINLIREIQGFKSGMLMNKFTSFTRNMKISTLVKFRTFTSGIGKILAALVGFIFASWILIYSIGNIWSIQTSIGSISNEITGNYVYINDELSKIDNSNKNSVLYEKVSIIESNSKKVNGSKEVNENNQINTNILGILKGNDSINIGNSINMSNDGLIIPLNYKNTYNMQINDTITFETAGTNKTYVAKISGFTESPFSFQIYTSPEYLSKILGFDSTFQNAYFSKNKQEISDHKFEINYSELINTITSNLSVIWALLLIVLIISLIIIIPTINIITSTIIDENKKDITIMKTFGYNNSELKSWFINIYRILTLIGFIIGSYCGIISSLYILHLMSEITSSTIEYNLPIWLNISMYVALFLCYQLAISLGARKLKKIVVREELSSFE